MHSSLFDRNDTVSFIIQANDRVGVDIFRPADKFARNRHVARGVDPNVAQSIQARWAYGPGNVLWDHEFVDVLSVDEDGRVLIDFRRFHKVRSIGRKADG